MKSELSSMQIEKNKFMDIITEGKMLNIDMGYEKTLP